MRADVAPALDPSAANHVLATRPAYTFLILVLGLHFTVGSALQVANPAFGISFGELFFFVGLTLLFVAGQNYRPVPFLALRLPPAATLAASVFAAIAGFFTAGALNGINRWIVGPEIAQRYDITGLFAVRSPFEAALLVFGVAVLAPIGEELVFRGYLLRVLGARYGTLAAVLVTSVLFAVIHLNPASILALFALGLVFALLRVYSGSIWPAIVGHALQNGTSSALVLSGLAAEAPDELPITGALVLFALSAPLLVWMLVRLRRLEAVPEDDAAAPARPEEGHHFALDRVLRPLAAWLVAALAAVALLVLVDGSTAWQRLQRVTGAGPELPAPGPAPTPEFPE